MEKQPIRILCVFSRLDCGGAETMCMNLYRQIDRSKVQFDFIKHTPSIGAFEEEILALGGQIYEAPQYVISNHISYQKWWSDHLQAHPEHQIVHGHFFTISPIYFSVARKLNRITIGHSHATEQQKKGLKTKLKKCIQKHTEEYSDYCFACGYDAGKWLFPHKEFTVLNNAVDTDRFAFNQLSREHLRTEFGLENAFLVGTIGRITPQKNPDGMVEIVKSICTKRDDARFLWVGTGELEDEAKAQVRAEGLEEKVIFTGVRSDIPEILSAIDAFILPSIFEGLPVVLVEAQAAGLTCFCSEAVTEEADITGLCHFLPLGQPDLWAEKILSADLTRKDTRQAICDAGYDIHTTAQWLQDFYLNLSSKT